VREFEDFMSEEIIVEAKDEKEMMVFLRLCEENGIIWKGTGNKPTEKPKFPIIRVGIENGKLAEGWICTVRGVVPASEFLANNRKTDIRITSHGKTTVCLKYENGKVVARGVARCNPEDKWDADYGAKLAFDRMMDREKEINWGKSLKDAGEKIAKQFAASQVNILHGVEARSLSNKENGIEVSPHGHINGDAVDTILPKEPKIKTLKDGTRIVKQDKYVVGDLVVFKKGKKPHGFPNFCTIAKELESFGRISNTFRFVKDGQLYQNHMWWHQDIIKGKVIHD